MRIQQSTTLVVGLVLAACVVTGTVWAAGDPFVGKWKVNASRSKLTDEMKVEALGADKYAITFGPGAVDTIVADGTDQPALQGTTLSITVARRAGQAGDSAGGGAGLSRSLRGDPESMAS